MKKHSWICYLLLFALGTAAAQAAPLRVFIRGGVKTHGPGQHDHPRFLGEWTKLLGERGAQVDGAMEFPTAAQLAKTDVLVIYAANGGTIRGEQRTNLEAYLKRGGGIVVIHDGVCGDDPQWFKTIVGGAWEHKHSKWLEGPMSLYYVDRLHPITQEVANFDFDDEIYYDLHMMPEARVLAAAYTPRTAPARKEDKRGLPPAGKVTVYDIQPQMWSYERENWRAFVSIPGHQHKNFSLPHYRAVLLRGIAWAGQRANVNELCSREELDSLRYPEGGPSRPEKSLSQLEIHPDFKVSLVATEPLINKVMNVDWDAQGRLWVAETPEYPDGRWANAPEDLVQRWVDGKYNPETGRYERPAYDRISILTDTTGDGVMDKKQIFYEGLELVTSFVFHKDGVIAAAAPDIWFLRDTNGDDQADQVEKLYTGLGTRDTHAVINNLRWGFDGWIYATHGYSAGTVTSPDGSQNFGNIGSGVVRFKPDGSAFEQYSSKGGNTWGLQITWDNEVFWTQPTSGDLLMHVVLSENQLTRGKVAGTTSFKVVRRSPKAYPPIPYDQLPYVQIDLVGSFTAAAGCVIYDGGSWPAQWNYNYFTTEPTINLVHHEIVTPESVSFTMNKAPEREEMEFIAGRDPWFRPIEVRTGPEGAMYMIDFYNQAVIHNDTRGPKHGPRNAAIRPDRDHYYGRIWRVDHQQAKKLDVPNLAKAKPAELVKALEHPNGHVRMNAIRLLAEWHAAADRGGNPTLLADSSPAARIDVKQQAAVPKPAEALLKVRLPVRQLAISRNAAIESRVAALWALHHMKQMNPDTLVKLAQDDHEAVRKNAMRALALAATDVPLHHAVRAAAIARLRDRHPAVRLEALNALASHALDEETAQALLDAYPSLDDNWSKSALLAAASQNPIQCLNLALARSRPDAYRELAAQLTVLVASKPQVFSPDELVINSASQPAVADGLKIVIYEMLAKSLKADFAPKWRPELKQAFEQILTTQNPAVAAAALPLIGRWDKQGVLAAELKKVLLQITTQLGEAKQSDEQRALIVNSLLGVRQMSPEILPAVGKLLGSSASVPTQRHVIDALGELPDAAAGAALVAAFPKLNSDLQTAAFNQLLKRAEWSLALLDALKAKSVDPAAVGPANLHRLRTHANAKVAQRANELFDELRGPEAKEKQALIAKLLPEVEKSGDIANGKELYAANCANCHKFGELGTDVGPVLTGMGAHSRSDLLTAIVDPNRLVDLAFVAWSIETKDGEIYDGIVVRENRDAVVLKNAAGEMEIKKSNIKARRNTGRSLMPEGFEALGAEGLRDLLAYMSAADQKYRFIDLAPALTADSRRGIYNRPESLPERLKFVKYGIVQVEGVPFNIVDPVKHPAGYSVMVLKGGNGFARTLPQKVETKVGFAASKLHFLGAVGGWAHPLGGGKVPVLKVTVHYAGGATEEIVMKNGEEFADYIREIEVPGSKLTKGIVSENQLRWCTKTLQGRGVIEKLVFESFGNAVAPTTVAVTAELAAGGADVASRLEANASSGQAPKTVAADVPRKGKLHHPGTIRTLIVGGGTHHDFHRWFNLADKALLETTGRATVRYTENADDILPALKDLDVLYLSNNKPIPDRATREAIFKFAESGKGLLLVHPALWYNWKDWPEYNQKLVGGGSRKHDKFGEFEVKLTQPNHPILKGVNGNFKITDELYYHVPDPAGAPIEVLATATSVQTGETHPQIWIVKHPRARIVCITLGHDGQSHSHPAYQQILKNALVWAAGK